MDGLNREDVPKYLQLAALLRNRIEDGSYPRGARLPSEATLIQETGFARDTVRKAMALLRDEGRIYIVHGLGTFVGPEPD